MSEVTEARNSASMILNKNNQLVNPQAPFQSLLYCGSEKHLESAPNKTQSKERLIKDSNSYKINRNQQNNPTINIASTQLLKRQIQMLETHDEHQAKLRYESEAFVLKKRRNNLFRSYDRWEENEEKYQKEQGAIIIDQQINRKKISNKNSIKIQKLLNNFFNKNFQQEKTLEYLEFISNKHKIPLSQQKKTVNNQIGYKQSDIRKVKKYQINAQKMPILGIKYDTDDKKNQNDNTQDEQLKNQELTISDVYEQGVDCFQNKSQFKGYTLPDSPLRLEFVQSKRQIFKLARQVNRFRQEREAICKKLAYLCMKQVQRKYLKSIRTQNQNVMRAKKLHRQCLIYWRKREKQLTQVKKKKEKLEAQLKKRQQQQHEAKKQEKRLQYIMYQSGLYSHFMATKLGMDNEQKKQLQKVTLPGSGNIQIDQEAAQLTVNQIINSKQQNLEKFSKPEQMLDFSSVDQEKLNQLVGTPSSFLGTLKQYQAKGLRWLNNLFEQGINGILADEMGLGKTIQAISLLAHVSQVKNVWGPFLIVAPNSTLFNWQQQFKRFCPSLKVLPYWGNIKQRKTLRKFFSSKKFTQKSDSPFHVVITSYQLTVTDEKVFKKMKWQFMILDEAHAIKNILSQRWNTLKQFQTRNRLLLTGTPIQNNMAQLWALLNFVMPDLFDSHQLFNQWFSKDIEAHSQDARQLDQIKIQRLHAILKPFMLRRVKKDVQHQIGKKIQHQILCQMTKRQKLLYESIKQRLNVKQLFKMFESKAKVQNLMNLVMQLRKVCNHPELFERRPAISPFLFQDIYYYTGYIPIKAGDIKLLSFSSKNPIKLNYPKLAYDHLNKYTYNRELKYKKILNIYSTQNQIYNPTFSALNLLNLSYSEIEFYFRQDPLYTGIIIAHWLKINSYSKKLSTKQNLLIYQNSLYQSSHYSKFILPDIECLRSVQNSYIPNATAPSIDLQINSCSYVNDLQLIKFNKFHKFILYGDYKQRFTSSIHYSNQTNNFNKNFKGIISSLPSLTKIQVINFGNLIADSSKLRQLDKILKEKKRNNDKVLIFCQMTKMIDILEDFMNMRKYSFFRLDGACNISDRRDMVNDFQKSTSKTFVFLLSTRAGGLGVTLTAANTVIFYDNDWNPTMDAQATDRAHRIGQSQDVNVYQLVTKGTIQQRIVKRAQQKKTVQSTVYEGASFNFFKKDMILELMVDQFDQNGNAIVVQEKSKKQKEGKQGKQIKEGKQKQKQVKQGKQGKQKKKTRTTKSKQEGLMNGKQKNHENKHNDNKINEEKQSDLKFDEFQENSENNQ